MRAAAFVVWLALLGATACQSERGASTAKAAVLPAGQRLALSEARAPQPGVDYERVNERPGAGENGIHIATLGLVGDGRLVTAASHPAPATNGMVTIAQTALRLEGRGEVERVAGDAVVGKPFQAVYADADERYTAWIESSSTELDFFEPRVDRHDWQTGTTTLLADSTPLERDGRLPVVPGESVPTVGAGKVSWATRYAVPASEDFGVRILARDVAAAGPIATLAEGGKLPAAVGTEVFYVRSRDVAPGFAAGRFEIRAVGSDGLRRLFGRPRAARGGRGGHRVRRAAGLLRVGRRQE